MNFPNYSTDKIGSAIGAKSIGNPGTPPIRHLLIDSRKLVHPQYTLFIAIKGERHDGHDFIADLYDRGVRNFLVSIQVKNEEAFPKASFFIVKNTMVALQQLCTLHRERYSIPLIGITGSNGKTITKEWLYELLHLDKHIARSPKSYNSQVGVPLSVWEITDEHDFAILEAGISQPGEMDKLEQMIKPTIGVFTNIGEAHSEGFKGTREKVKEKLKLFTSVDVLIYCKDYEVIDAEIQESIKNGELDKDAPFTWSAKEDAQLQIKEVKTASQFTKITGVIDENPIEIEIPFSDKASIENAIHCWAVLLYLRIPASKIQERMKTLHPIGMRMELKEGINHCTLINDSYNSDMGSLLIALDFLNQQKQFKKKVVILSDILQTGRDEESLYKEVAEIINKKGVDRILGIGKAISRQAEQFSTGGSFYPSTEDFLSKFSGSMFHDEIILLKGARQFQFEQISKMLEQKAHETLLEVNLDAVVHNLNAFKSKLNPDTKIMAMVKAFSYGTGSYEIANVLQFHHIDYLAVAYADGGVELRKSGITTPVMVMNPEEQSFDAMIRYHLEPEIYSIKVFDAYLDALNKISVSGPVPIHIKVETGMHRLGVEKNQLDLLMDKIDNSPSVFVKSVFSHLAASEDSKHDDFSKQQIERFKDLSGIIANHFDYPIIRHLLNSHGVLRFPEAQFEMVRLGIGIYGVSHFETEQFELKNVSTLKSRISQVKTVQKDETIGYGRKGLVSQEMVIAIIPVGYADGLNRKLGNGKGKLWINGDFAPIVGDICMDMCMVDVTGKNVNEGDEVIVFGEQFSVVQFAKALSTIPYEVLTSISQRVKRVYIHE